MQNIYKTIFLFDDQFPLVTSVIGVFLNSRLANGTTINTTIRRLVICDSYGYNSFASFIDVISSVYRILPHYESRLVTLKKHLLQSILQQKPVI
jgi:hypothetical protein